MRRRPVTDGVAHDSAQVIDLRDRRPTVPQERVSEGDQIRENYE